jgi:hypothetical protein
VTAGVSTGAGVAVGVGTGVLVGAGVNVTTGGIGVAIPFAGGGTAFCALAR